MYNEDRGEVPERAHEQPAEGGRDQVEEALGEERDVEGDEGAPGE
jgi:hypothetical protein